jgi:hypothetical protein
LLARLESRQPGHRFLQPDRAPRTYHVTGEALSARPLERVDVVVNGVVRRHLSPENRPGSDGGFVSPISMQVDLEESAWIAVRCFERQPDGRVRFAHTGPFHVEMGGDPVRPRRREIGWLASRMREEIDRNRTVLDEEALGEYRQALAVYERIERHARD